MTDDDSPRPRHHWIKEEHSDHIFAGWGERKFGRVERHVQGWREWNPTCLDGVRDLGPLRASWYGRAETTTLAAGTGS
ncbi:hypothetical protein J2Y48_003154 [Mycoplana sp. BE70]|nr:hypothetical protein [Mycoplana sp. BE70]